MHGERATATRRALIDATAARLATSDESELRIADVCEDTGYSSSVIYSNFRSRQGLIDAALLAMFDQRSRDYIDLLRHYTHHAQTREELFSFYAVPEKLERITETLTELRQIRLRVSTAALARPDLRREWQPVQEAHVERFAELIEAAQARGLLGRALSSREIVALFEALSFGRALDAVSLRPLSDRSWLSMLLLVVDGLEAQRGG
ncbi:MAG: TetR/AcrR family transcriptional regulator [Acidimicrobiales bacterium]